MRGSPVVIDALNNLLAGELTAMDVYLIQSRMFRDWGFGKIYERLSHEMDDERNHAVRLVERILFLGGVPDMSARHSYTTGADPRALLEEALRLEYSVASNLNDAMGIAVEAGDNGTRALLEELLADTERDHILWLEAQLRLISQLGEQQYLAEQL